MLENELLEKDNNLILDSSSEEDSDGNGQEANSSGSITLKVSLSSQQKQQHLLNHHHTSKFYVHKKKKKKKSNHLTIMSDQLQEITLKHDPLGYSIKLIDFKSLTVSKTQVAGHGTRKSQNTKELSLFVHENKVFKAIQIGKKRSFTEVEFYEKQIIKVPFLLPFIPKYYGIYRSLLNDNEHSFDEELLKSFLVEHRSLNPSPSISSCSSRLSELSEELREDVLTEEKLEEQKQEEVKEEVHKAIDFLVLEDITAEFNNPNIMDIKMGQRTYGEDATPEKILEEESKFKYQREFGFRVSGAKVFDNKTNSYITFGRNWGRTMNPDNILDCFELFFFPNTISTLNDNTTVINKNLTEGQEEKEEINEENRPKDEDEEKIITRKNGLKALEVILKELKKVSVIFSEKQSYFKFYSSSLLFVLDPSSGKAKLKMIDFSHVFEMKEEESERIDNGYLHGVNYLINLFTKLYEKHNLFL
ncbi:hypothetical protein ABK040_012351 [Willaertia magna]